MLSISMQCVYDDFDDDDDGFRSFENSQTNREREAEKTFFSVDLI